MSVPLIPLGEFMGAREGSVDPQQHPDEVFDLYSIPAFDAGAPESARGDEIGSSKLIVQTGDVLLSRIVPHIRRAWTVSERRAGRQIASGEWIIFRTNRLDANYLRHFLISDRFHAQFMNTVSGVGGSLLRARPSYVAQIPIPVPDLAEQQQIADILDRADALRAKRRAALAQLDTLTQSIFLDMFGDVTQSSKPYRTDRLGALCSRITDGTHQPPQWSEIGHPFLFVSNIISGEISFDAEKFISDDTWTELTRRCPIEVGDVLYSTVGSYGVPAIVRDTRRFAFQRHIAHLKPNRALLDSEFLCAMLASTGVRRQADQRARGVAQKTLNLEEIRNYLVLCPPIAEQRLFAHRAAEVEKLREQHRKSLSPLDELFASLQHRAFVGDR